VGEGLKKEKSESKYDLDNESSMFEDKSEFP
jgi:hypothetical protein